MVGVHDVQAIAEPWLAFMTRCLIEGSIAFCIVLAVWLPLKKRAPAQLGYALFLLVLLKLALPVSIPAPAWAAWLAPETLLSTTIAQIDGAPIANDAPVIESGLTYVAPLASAQQATRTPWESWLFLAWLSIASCLLLRFTSVQLRTRRLVDRARPARPGELGVDCDELLRLARVRRPVRWLITDAVDSPAAGGLTSSYVLIPAGLVPHLQARPLTWVLLHELAHIRRGDLWVAAAQRLLSIAFFFHPVVWLANWLIDEQREFACDEDALTASRAEPRECGAGFLTVVEWVQDRESGAAATLAMFAPKSVIRRRLMRILNHDQKSRAGRVWTTSCVLATALFVLPSARVRAEVAPTDSLTLEAQDPGDAGLDELRRELAELRRQNAALQQQLSKLAKKVGSGRNAVRSRVGSGGGGGAGAGTGAGQGRSGGPSAGGGSVVRSGGRVVEIPSGTSGLTLVERDGKVVEVEPDGQGIYVVGSRGGFVTDMTTKKAQGGGKGGAVRYYVTDGTATVEAEVERQSEGTGGGVLRGTVLNLQGEPTAGARIVVRSQGGGGGDVVSDSEGRFEVRELVPGRSQVIVVTPDGEKTLHEVISEQGQLTVIRKGDGASGGTLTKPTKTKKRKTSESGKIRIY